MEKLYSRLSDFSQVTPKHTQTRGPSFCSMCQISLSSTLSWGIALFLLQRFLMVLPIRYVGISVYQFWCCPKNPILQIFFWVPKPILSPNVILLCVWGGFGHFVVLWVFLLLLGLFVFFGRGCVCVFRRCLWVGCGVFVWVGLVCLFVLLDFFFGICHVF